jgi:hypothetical protein
MSDERNEFEYEENGNNNNASGGFDNENNYSYQTVRNFGKPKTMGWSVVSLVTGILSVICCCLGFTGIFFGAAAIISAIVSRKMLGYFDGLSIAGLVLGIFGAVFGAAILISVTALGDEFWDAYMEEFWRQYNEMYPDTNGNI